MKPTSIILVASICLCLSGCVHHPAARKPVVLWDSVIPNARQTALAILGGESPETTVTRLTEGKLDLDTSRMEYIFFPDEPSRVEITVPSSGRLPKTGAWHCTRVRIRLDRTTGIASADEELVLYDPKEVEISGPDGVVVKALNKPLPPDKLQMQSLLWKSFANKPEEKRFGLYTTREWKQTFQVFAAALVKKADAQRLGSAALQKALDLVLQDAGDKVAYLPIGAYKTVLEGRPVWIVTVKWEGVEGEKDWPSPLGHICAYAFDEETMRQVGFMTCG